jgi:tetraacyldisaccharide 4'-kinase
MRLRTAAYRLRWRRVVRLPLPSVAVGNLSVGGTGKTPLAAWIARYYAGRGHRPGIVLRGYGGDEALVHQRLVPEAVVVANPDRAAGTRVAAAGGASVVVLDDAYQLLGVARDLNIAVLSADSLGASVWPLPAGPWREGVDALERASVIVITRKHAAFETASGFADWIERRRPGTPVCIAHLALGHLEAMRSGARIPTTALAGRRVVAVAGIADPASFAAQLGAAGASVQLLAYQDHHAYRPADLAQLARAAAGGDYVVVTEKDAVKLRGRWPEHGAEPLVAVLDVRWERNGRALEQALDAVLAPAARA